MKKQYGIHPEFKLLSVIRPPLKREKMPRMQKMMGLLFDRQHSDRRVMVEKLMAIDRGLPVPCAQLLTYPAVGNCGETESLRLYTDTPMCNTEDMNTYGEWYVQDESAGKLAYRSPIEAESFAGIPMTYIETAEFDCLRDGAILYAEKLRENGIPVELYNTKGTVHGYDMMLRSGIVKDLIEKRIRFLEKALCGRTR